MNCKERTLMLFDLKTTFDEETERVLVIFSFTRFNFQSCDYTYVQNNFVY